jgi:TRAP-type C4-dicarboxylate transport system permease small subunit
MNKNETEYGNTPYLGRILTVVYRIEDGILAAVLTLMIALAVVQILLRNFFGAGFIWGDVLVRVLVLWIGLIGAMIATRQNKHISIDLVARYLPKRFDLPVKAVVQLFAAVVCALAAFYSFVFVHAEYYDGGRAFGQVPVWVCEAIMPLAFAVMALRYFMMSLMRFQAVFRPNNGEEPNRRN